MTSSTGELMTKPTSIERINVSVYTIPTDVPESDGTLEWDKTTLVLVEAMAGGLHGWRTPWVGIHLRE